MGSLCEICRNPGRCCAGFHLNQGNYAKGVETPLEAMVFMASTFTVDVEGRPILGAPFMPLMKDKIGWRWWCPLLVNGRCSDYAHRPELCGSYQAGTDRLCAEHVSVLSQDCGETPWSALEEFNNESAEDIEDQPEDDQRSCP